MSNWKIEIEEVSNHVYKLVMTHKYGSVIEKTGTNLDAMKIQATKDSIKIEKDIDEKLKTHN